MGLVGWIARHVAAFLFRERPPVLQDPARFERGAVAFEYPRNWKVTEENLEDGCLSVDLETAMGGVCCVCLSIPNVGLTLAEYAEGAVSGYDEGVADAFRLGRIQPFRAESWSVDTVIRRIAAKDRQGVRLEVRTKGLGESVRSRFEIFHLDEPDSCVFVLTNAVELADWDVDLPGFELLWGSLSIDASRGLG